MNIDELQRKFFAAARALPPSAHVPYAFEKRVMSHLPAAQPVDVLAVWSRWLWRAAGPCVAIMLLMSAWTAYAHKSSTPSQTLAADLERTVWGPLTSLGDTL